jgi:glutathione S-transferase
MRATDRRNQVIDVYTWTTGNSRKIPIFLEETALPYRLHMVDIHKGEQFRRRHHHLCLAAQA